MVLAGVSRLEHCRDLFKTLNILTLPSLYILQCLLYFNANSNKVQLRSDVHSHNTRGRLNVDLPQARLMKSGKGLLHMSINLFNKLPMAFRQLDCKRFKQKLEAFLLKEAFYSVNEFMCRKWSASDFNL